MNIVQKGPHFSRTKVEPIKFHAFDKFTLANKLMISNFKVQVHEINTSIKTECLLFFLHVVKAIRTNGLRVVTICQLANLLEVLMLMVAGGTNG
jgi:hypothetical protein